MAGIPKSQRITDPKVFEKALKRLMEAHPSEFRRYLEEEQAAHERRLRKDGKWRESVA